MIPTEVAAKFKFPGRLIRMEPISSGNVNDTFLVVFRTSFDEQRGIIQRINTSVFKKQIWLIVRRHSKKMHFRG